MKVPCPNCEADLQMNAAVNIVGFVLAKDDPEGKDRADLILECEACGTAFNTFVAIGDFQRID